MAKASNTSRANRSALSSGKERDNCWRSSDLKQKVPSSRKRSAPGVFDTFCHSLALLVTSPIQTARHTTRQRQHPPSSFRKLSNVDLYQTGPCRSGRSLVKNKQKKLLCVYFPFHEEISPVTISPTQPLSVAAKCKSEPFDSIPEPRQQQRPESPTVPLTWHASKIQGT